MRIGTNPEKKILTKIIYKPHRVIIPVYIPDSKEEYFKNLFKVFKVSIESLIKSINQDNTNITIINNNCKLEVSNYIDGLLNSEKIDKHVKFSCNYGKVHAILSEAKASYEDIITISDADVFFFNNWVEESFKIFNTFKNVGVVAPLPMPQLAFYANSTLFSQSSFRVKKGNIVKKEDIELFEKSINRKISIKKENWYEKQFFLKNNKTKACIGAGHFVASYKREIFNSINLKKSNYVFEDGAEKDYLDIPIDKKGFYRVSTIKTYAYHLGNTIPDFLKNYTFKKNETQYFYENSSKNDVFMPYSIRKLLAKIYRKFI